MLGIQYRSAFVELKKALWEPDIVISHSGWGCGLVKEIWPSSRFKAISNGFNPTSEFFSYDESNKSLNINKSSIKKSWQRNQQIALELSVSDNIVSPTNWQKNQLPPIFREKCRVVFDGIELEKFNSSLRIPDKSKFTITYGTRGMDPMRCFPTYRRNTRLTAASICKCRNCRGRRSLLRKSPRKTTSIMGRLGESLSR